MNIKRRDFIKGCATISILSVPCISFAALSQHTQKSDTSVSNHQIQIEKSIKANFGGGFTVQAHTELNGLTYAKIQHLGVQYTATTSDLLEWKTIS